MDLSIIVVNYQTCDLLDACLCSLRSAQIKPHHEIVVLDNGSRDGTQEVLQRHRPDVVIQNRQNVGFARAVNIACQRAHGKYVLVLNPDIEIFPSSVETLFDYMEAHLDVALCAPKLLNSDGTLQYSCRAYYTLASLILRRSFLGKVFPDHPVLRGHLMLDWDHSSSREVDWVLGAAFMLRREAIPDGQVMDERFFLYFEDVDLCLRLQKAGWKVIYYPGAVMIHHHQRESAKRILSRAKFEHMKSWIKFSWKHRHEPLLHLSRNKGHG